MPSPPQDRDPWRMTQPLPCSCPHWTDSTCHPEQHCYCVLRFAWPLTKSWSPVDTLLLDGSVGTIYDYWNTPYPSGRLRHSSRLLIKYSFLVHVVVFLRAFRSKPHPRPLYSCLHAFIQNKKRTESLLCLLQCSRHWPFLSEQKQCLPCEASGLALCRCEMSYTQVSKRLGGMNWISPYTDLYIHSYLHHLESSEKHRNQVTAIGLM